MFNQKVKPVKLTWTLTWRRMNKKDTAQTTIRRKNRKTTKFQKAIVGMSLEDMRKKKAQRPELRQAALAAKETAEMVSKPQQKQQKQVQQKQKGGAKPQKVK